MDDGSRGGGGELECTIVTVARPRDDNSWYASLEVPAALRQSDGAARTAILDAARESLAELRRLNLATERTPGATQLPRLVFNCSVWAQRGASGQWQTSVTFNWPSTWPSFSREARDRVMAALETAFNETRKRLLDGDAPAS